MKISCSDQSCCGQARINEEQLAYYGISFAAFPLLCAALGQGSSWTDLIKGYNDARGWASELLKAKLYIKKTNPNIALFHCDTCERQLSRKYIFIQIEKMISDTLNIDRTYLRSILDQVFSESKILNESRGLSYQETSLEESDIEDIKSSLLRRIRSGTIKKIQVKTFQISFSRSNLIHRPKLSRKIRFFLLMIVFLTIYPFCVKSFNFGMIGNAFTAFGASFVIMFCLYLYTYKVPFIEFPCHGCGQTKFSFSGETEYSYDFSKKTRICYKCNSEHKINLINPWYYLWSDEVPERVFFYPFGLIYGILFTIKIFISYLLIYGILSFLINGHHMEQYERRSDIPSVFDY